MANLPRKQGGVFCLIPGDFPCFTQRTCLVSPGDAFECEPFCEGCTYTGLHHTK